MHTKYPQGCGQYFSGKLTKKLKQSLISTKNIAARYNIDIQKLKQKIQSWTAKIDDKIIAEQSIITKQYLDYINGHIEGLFSVMTEIDE